MQTCGRKGRSEAIVWVFGNHSANKQIPVIALVETSLRSLPPAGLGPTRPRHSELPRAVDAGGMPTTLAAAT